MQKGKGHLNSIKKYKEHNKLGYAVKISTNNYGFYDNNKILTIPLYMFFAYINDIKNKNMEVYNNIPNKITMDAINEVEEMDKNTSNNKTFNDVDELIGDLNK